jgi:hypothetical protein
MTCIYFQYQNGFVHSFPHYTLQNLQILKYILEKQKNVEITPFFLYSLD